MRILSNDKDRTTITGEPVPEWVYGLLLESVARGFTKEAALARFANIPWQIGWPITDYKASFYRIDPKMGDRLYVFKNAQENQQYIAILTEEVARGRGLIFSPGTVPAVAPEAKTVAELADDVSALASHVQHEELARTIREYEVRVGAAVRTGREAEDLLREAIEAGRKGGLKVDWLSIGQTSIFASVPPISITIETITRRTF